jgi:hypothetical protein
MLYINEWFPNPVGNDNAGEFIELYNSGSAAVGLGGYEISDGAKKQFSLAGYVIPANGYLSLGHTQTKLTLKNSSGSLWLYGPGGQLVDGASFTGVAPQGKSYSRVDYSNASIGHFAFLYPTPGEKNETFDATVTTRNYPLGISLSSQLSPISFLALFISVPLFFLLFFIYVTRTNRNISNFFFRRDEEVGI